MERFVSASIAPLVIAMAVTLSFGCAQDTSGEAKYSGAVVKETFAELPNCAQGKYALVYYVQETGQFYYCDGWEYIHLTGLVGEAGIGWVVETAPAMVGCLAGGATITAGPDANRDGIMDEVTSSQTVCNGVDGADGADGQDGISWVVETEAILSSGGPPCPAGGVIINVGPDANADSQIDGEPTYVETICEGVDGQDGIGWAVETATLPALGDLPCPAGGVVISAGPDANRDGQIDDEPPPFNDTICNGETGAGCTVVDNENGTYNITCGDSTVTVSDPACTVDDNGDGTATIRCNDGTHATVTNLQQCGDGIVHYGEECDDGNLQERDGCSSVCVIEYSVCGDGVLEWDEQCDDGNTVDGDDCNASCLLELCGDGTVNNSGTEGCDDGNTVDGDGCSASCLLEVCGNGVVTSGTEECDDGNTVDGDGCAADCTYELVCGDGYVAPPNNEECDDGNNEGGDACGADCRYEFLIAYSAYYAEELFTNIPNGAEQQFVASIDYRTSVWDWSPDGTRIAYRADHLYTNTPDGSDPRQVNAGFADSNGVSKFAWSPDGTRIAYVQEVPGGVSPSGDCSLVPPQYIGDGDCDCPPNGSTACDIIDCSDNGNPPPHKWCGCEYCYGPAGSVTQELYTNAWDGSDNRKVNGPLVAGGEVRDFSWSPDGTLIAYEADQDTEGMHELYTGAWDGSGNVKINDLLVADGDVDAWAWSPSGDLIAYTADQETYNIEELYAGTPDGQTKHKVSGVPAGYVRNFQWSPDGTHIAYLFSSYSLFVGTPDGSNNYEIEVSSGEYAWSPDGTRIGFKAEISGTFDDELYTSNPDGTDRARVHPLLAEGSSVSDFAWSPDGTRVAYRADQNIATLRELFTSRWNGSENHWISVPMASDRWGVAQFVWSPDGTRLAYEADQRGFFDYELFASTWDGLKMDKVNAPLGTDGVMGFKWSPSGGRIAYWTDYDRLYTAAPDGSDHHHATDLPDGPYAEENVYEFAWSPVPNR
jgi:cysteine-rich repeat protein